MSNRALASASRKRGTFKDPAAYEKLFEHLKYIGNGKYEILPFDATIRGDKHNGKLPHNVPVKIKNWDGLADWANISTNNLRSILAMFPNGYDSGKKSRMTADPHAAEYDLTVCHQLLVKKYGKNGVIVEKGGKSVDSFGRLLYLMNDRKDPAYFTLEQFQEAKNNPRFHDANGEITYGNLGAIRRVMLFAAMEADESPLKLSNFRFKENDEWSTKGKKNIGGKKDTYLQPEELDAFIMAINRLDVLVLYRLIFEGMSRVSSGCLMGKDDVDGRGYRCFMIETQNACLMFEPKVKKSKTGGKVKRFFTNETMAFFKRYLLEQDIKGAWFPFKQSYYQEALRAAGLRAGLWRFKTAGRNDTLEKNEKLDLSAPRGNGQFLVYKLVAFNNRSKGTVEHQKEYVIEGKMTSSHIVGKHTGVSIAGLHGFSLDNCAEQAGTEPSTIRDFYHGTLGVDLQKVVMGERTYQPWNEYIKEHIDPLFRKRYNELRRGNVAPDAADQAAAAVKGVDEE